MPTTTPRPTAAEAREANRRRIVEAAADLVRESSYTKLTVGSVMERAGLERTIFYRHFDDLFELLRGTGRQAIEELYAAQVALSETRLDYGPEAVREAVELPVRVYERHGPILRAVSEAAGADEARAALQAPVRERFDELIAETLRGVERETGRSFADVNQTARALNLLAESYLLDAFGRGPRVSVETAVQTLSEIWVSLTTRPGGSDAD
jgi:TetR/AcrR family transcriptional regulator, ethionamide resistance regulator